MGGQVLSGWGCRVAVEPGNWAETLGRTERKAEAPPLLRANRGMEEML